MLKKLASSTQINMSTKWTQYGFTVAGGNEPGTQLNRLFWPHVIYVDNDDDQTIYIADYGNNRVVKWTSNANSGQIVAGKNGYGYRNDQCNQPTDVIVDKKTNSMIICDWGNKRVVRWPCENAENGQTIISNIDCSGLAMDNNGNLYVSDYKKGEVRRWEKEETNGKLVAGGNGRGNHLNQLNGPTYIFVDQDYSVYVSDNNNHRVMKWVKGAKQGIVVAGGQGLGNSLAQLSNPHGVIVDHLDNVYVADFGNNRIMRWSKGSKKGSIIVGGDEQGHQQNQFSGPIGLSFDRENNLYVVDHWNNRIQKFHVDLT
ncbi:unnamed protein product [Rotaria socialis]|uniref:Uncharacterized protein n=2 Tax=Rotaria socialis TaxID=392032 RepID=A0A820CQY3_9BILA|nr:unnamed protein product [Rotaria socialis]CAF4212196.1 unnamed protein product [Rotaria socialis]CAF4443250.1 unnamed protein product [Rotaria socialis]CAF4644910.1 unnamed protein product [Rotaria socialis]